MSLERLDERLLEFSLLGSQLGGCICQIVVPVVAVKGDAEEFGLGRLAKAAMLTVDSDFDRDHACVGRRLGYQTIEVGRPYALEELSLAQEAQKLIPNMRPSAAN